MTGNELIAIYKKYLEADLAYNNARVQWQQLVCWAKTDEEWATIERLKEGAVPMYGKSQEAHQEWKNALKTIESQWGEEGRQAFYARYDKEKNDKS